MKYEVKDFSKLLGTAGFSDELLKNHFTLYEGYVANTNKLMEQVKALNAEGKEATVEFAELKRRLGWEWNGMRLHELYFENIGGDGDSGKAPKALEVIKSAYGSLEMWQKGFAATGKMRGIGWAVLYYDRTSGDAWNTWITEHDAGHLAGATPLLVMDVFEHAYLTDYGLKRPDYIDAFLKVIDWPTVEKRLL